MGGEHETKGLETNNLTRLCSAQFEEHAFTKDLKVKKNLQNNCDAYVAEKTSHSDDQILAQACIRFSGL